MPEVEARARSSAPRERVWELLSDVTTWPSWTPFTQAHYEVPGDPAPHGTGAVRRLRLAGTWSTERVLGVEPPARFAYAYSGPLPLRGHRGEVLLEPDGTGTAITWRGRFDNGLLTGGPVLALVLRAVLGDITQRLARAAERQR